MGSFLKALSKVGLVELEAEELASARSDVAAPDVDLDALAADLASLEDQLSTSPTPAADITAASPIAASSSTAIEENVAFEQIYEKAKVKVAPFSAEKLLKLLGGLAAMDEATRKAAVLAMDSADEAWSIEDPLLDAQRKIHALQDHSRSLAEVVRATESKATADVQARETYQKDATETIRAQIMELEETLAKELATVAEEKAEITATVQAARQAALREDARLRTEMTRLGEILKVFGSVVSEPDEGN